jgi:hypothetical protein
MKADVGQRLLCARGRYAALVGVDLPGILASKPTPQLSNTVLFLRFAAPAAGPEVLVARTACCKVIADGEKTNSFASTWRQRQA